jgi:23S rRNA (guanine745-N1)-methyltransferase
MSLTCPLCHGALVPAEKSYRCEKGHAFARDRVHRAGVFDPLVKALAALPFVTPPKSILELGCGEGFFLGHMVLAHGIAASYGLDLSVDAVKLAAKTLKQSLILRADLLNPLPFADGSLDLIQSIFAPRPLAEIKRVLSPGGHALFVYPEGDHWQELRAFLPLAKIGEEKLPPNLEGFASAASSHVCAKIGLSHAALVDLVEMSPSIHRLTREGTPWQTLLPGTLSATLSLRVVLFRKAQA